MLAEIHELPLVNAPTVRAVRRRYSKIVAGESPDFVLAIARRLLSEKSWAARVVAFELLDGHDGARSRLRAATVEQMAVGLSDWGSVDLFGVTIAGPAWREGRISDRHVMRWARSKDRWRRRLSLVATVPLNSKARGGAGDSRRTLAVCRLLVGDGDDMVVKALSWALREFSKRDAESVRAFLRTEDTRLAARVRREVRAKLETGRKVRKRPVP
ncbi:MAG TPA: DNA alkylation repair protein [Vicinamibacterales bacterium]|nr:DNA alkylation repair protein [Vicinamibacterales bacterium]